MKHNDFIVYQGFRYVRADSEESAEVTEVTDDDVEVVAEEKADAEVKLQDDTPSEAKDAQQDEKFYEKKIISLLEEIVTLLKTPKE